MSLFGVTVTSITNCSDKQIISDNHFFFKSLSIQKFFIIHGRAACDFGRVGFEAYHRLSEF